MHSDLSAHLHTPECNEIINELKKCHETNKFGRFVGVCNAIDALMNRCLREERKQNQAANLRKAQEKQQQFKERLRQNAGNIE